MIRKFVFGLLGAITFAGCAYAADLSPAPVEPMAPIAVPSWTGFYVGAEAGYSHKSADFNDPNGGQAPGTIKTDGNGFAGMGFAGYRYQFDQYPVVLGAEVSLGWNGARAEGTKGSAHEGNLQHLKVDTGLYADATVHVGYAFGDFLPYVLGGWAYDGGKGSQKTTFPGYITHETSSFSGPVLGAGLDYRITDHLVIGIVYKHVFLNKQTGDQLNVNDASSPAGYKFKFRSHPSDDMVLARLAWTF